MIRAWMRENGHEAAAGGATWDEYWSEPSTPPSETRTVVIWPLAAR